MTPGEFLETVFPDSAKGDSDLQTIENGLSLWRRETRLRPWQQGREYGAKVLETRDRDISHRDRTEISHEDSLIRE